MSITDIIKKLLAGETLTDDEKSFAEKFDLQGQIDKASAAARRKAEGERDANAKTIEELNAKLKELEDAGGKGETEISKLRKEVEKLSKAKAESDAKVAAQERRAAIAACAKANGVNMADGVSASAFEQLLNIAVGDTKVDDEDAMKAVMETFKRENPAMIADGGHSGVGGKGKPNSQTGSFVGNPFKKGAENLTAQMQLMKENPAEAARLAAAEGVTLEI